MTWYRTAVPVCEHGDGLIELVIEPRSRDLGGFTVRRALPADERRLVGPFIFFDEMGPADFPPGEGMNVRPHPHICLATVTYLFAGQILHRDSLGYVQPIEPGAVNLMTAGRGIVHSERTDPERLANGQHLHGIQIWIALPDGAEEIEPAFEHYPASSLPALSGPGIAGAVIIGSAYGLTSPVKTYSETIYVHVDLDADATIELPAGVAELGIYVVSGQVEIGGRELATGNMGVLRSGASGSVRATMPARLIILGGEPIGHREIWWNFVASSRERIEQAKQDWLQSGFDPVPGDDEFIPLPDTT